MDTKGRVLSTLSPSLSLHVCHPHSLAAHLSLQACAIPTPKAHHFFLTPHTMSSLNLSPQPPTKSSKHPQDTSIQLTIPSSYPPTNQLHNESPPLDYLSRAQWLRAAVLGASDGLVSVASIMIGIGAVNKTTKAMLVSGLAGLVAGACSMAIGEFISVYAQYDIEIAQMKREKIESRHESTHLPSPIRAAVASFVAFAMGAILPVLAGGFIRTWSVRIAVVCVVTSLGLGGFGAAGAVLGGAHVWRSMVRILVGGWMAMLFTFGVIKVFGVAFGMQLS